MSVFILFIREVVGPTMTSSDRCKIVDDIVSSPANPPQVTRDLSVCTHHKRLRDMHLIIAPSLMCSTELMPCY